MICDVVVVNYNTDFYLLNLLASIRDRLPRARIAGVHVWDNASTDQSLPMLAAFASRAPWLRVYRSPVNVYHGPALDRLLREHCRQEWVLVLDSDAEVLGDFFSHLPPLEDTPAFVGQMSASARQLYACPFHLLLHRPSYLRFPPFRHHGAPGIDLYRHVEERGVPYRRFRWSTWVRHYGQGSLRGVYARGERDNVFFEFARRETHRRPPSPDRQAWEDRLRQNLAEFLRAQGAGAAGPVGELIAVPPPGRNGPEGVGQAFRAVVRRVPGARRLKAALAAFLTSAEAEALGAAYAIGMNQRRAEIRRLYRRVKALRPDVVLETGTAYGGTLYLWTRLAADAGTLVSLDVPPWELDDPDEEDKVALFRTFRRAGQTLHLLRKEAWRPQTRDEVAALLGNRQADFLFVDGDHAHGGVRRDFEEYAPLVRRGGLVAIHDIRPHRSGWAAEVPAFWAEMSRGYRTEELVDRDADDGYGIGLIHL